MNQAKQQIIQLKLNSVKNSEFENLKIRQQELVFHNNIKTRQHRATCCMAEVLFDPDHH